LENSQKEKNPPLNKEKIIGEISSHSNRTNEMSRQTQQFLKGKFEIKTYER
jgi:hypothetical protein